MKTIHLFIAVGLLGLFTSCKKEQTAENELKPVQLSEKQQLVINQVNSFGFDFFRKVCEASGNEKNMMVSPLSVSIAFGMARNGAGGGTLEAMSATLGLSAMTDAEANASYKYIIDKFESLDPRVKMSIANSIWYRNSFTVLPDFLSTNKEYFNAEVSPLDFGNPDAVETINSWVSDKTNALIPSIIDNIPEDMVMYLINAIYFKGQWKYQFDKANTADKPFHRTDGSTIQAAAMIQHAQLSYFQGENFEAVELPYNQGNFNMTVLLPASGVPVTDVVNQLTTQNWETWVPQFTPRDIQIQLPRFRFTYQETKMIPVLSDMGMAVAFNPDLADFTRINSDGGLYISDVRHKTFIETNEEGTEAAAVTSIGISVTSVGEDPVPYDFIVDRPFVFLITEKSTGSVLFIGTLMNPAEN